MFSRRLRRLTPYVPGEQPREGTYIKLNSNENPYPPCPGIQRYLAAADAGELRLYPDPVSNNLRRAIAGHYGIPADMVFVGNGSDEILSFAFYGFFDSFKGPLLFPEYTYSFYPVYCAFYDVDYRKVPLKPDFTVDLDGCIGLVETCGVIFPNPNAPTGIALTIEEIDGFLHRYPRDRVVVIDEAYIDFGGVSALSLLDRYPNLAVVHTFSKSRSLAGIRLGFAMSNPPVVRALTTVKDSFNSYPVNKLTQRIGEIALREDDYYRNVSRKIIKTRERFSSAAVSKGWEVLPSSANFVFMRKPGTTGRTIYEGLKSEGILVRHFGITGIDAFVRVTIGTDEEMDILLKAMGKKW